MSDPNQIVNIPVNLAADGERLSKVLPDYDTSEGRARVKEVLMRALTCYAEACLLGDAFHVEPDIQIALSLLEEC